MPSYRFCRSDDVGAMIEAYNLCYLPHAPGEPGLTVDRFRSLVRELDVWTSSCMLATHDRAPIGVLIATKREREALIWCVAIRPGFERQGHGRHLVTSLSQKLAILGPPRIQVEVPQARSGACSFFDACGFRRDTVYTDCVLNARPAPAPVQSASLVIPVSVDDLVANGVLEPETPRPWARTNRVLLARRERITGEAVSSADRLEAWLLYTDEHADANEPCRRILALGIAEPASPAKWLDVLLRRAACSARGTVALERATPAELELGSLESLGFERTRTTIGFATESRPG